MPVISAPPFLVQLFFQDQDGSGWSENWWWNADSYQAALDDWKPNTLGTLAELRQALFSDKVKITYVRVSDATVKRDTLVLGVEEADGKGSYVPTVGDMLPADDALLLRLQGFNDVLPVFTLHPLRALPEECVKDGVFDPVAAWTTNLDAFITALKTKGRMVLKTATGVAAVSISDIQKMHMTQRKTGRPFGLSRGRLMRP